MSRKLGGPDAPYRHTAEAKAEEVERAARSIVFVAPNCSRSSEPGAGRNGASMIEPPRIFCNDECGNSVPDDPVNAPIEGTGWEFLPITRRYRCIECKQKLERVNGNDQS